MPKATNVFSFAAPVTKHFTDRVEFFEAARAVQDGYDLVAASDVDGMDVDGNLSGVTARLTARAFSDVCALTGTPEPFVRRIAKRNESLAMDIVRDAVNSGLLRDCVLLVDTESRRVDAVVDESKHNTPDIPELMRLALSASKETRFMGGWLNGTTFRMTATGSEVRDVKTGAKATVGDLMGVGFEILSDIGSVGQTTITDYAERLSCLNGMLARDSSHAVVRKHAKWSIDDDLLKSFLVSFERAGTIFQLAKRASQHFFDGNGARKIVTAISEGSHPAASQKLCDHAKKQAMAEAQRDCRPPGAICLWDFVNGVTDAAKHAASLDRRRDIEHFGYTLMCDVLDPS